MSILVKHAKTYGFKPENRDFGVRSETARTTDRFCLLEGNPAFVTTFDFNDSARNHCAATSLVNLLLLAVPDRQKRAEGRNLFPEVHRCLPNGPIFAMKKRSEAFFRKASLPVTAKTLWGPLPLSSKEKAERIRAALSGGTPCALLLAADLFHWHWVIALGYKGDELLIEDNWHARGLQTYTPDRGSVLLAAIAYQGVALPVRARDSISSSSI